jgi:hypothetical protein
VADIPSDDQGLLKASSLFSCPDSDESTAATHPNVFRGRFASGKLTIEGTFRV